MVESSSIVDNASSYEPTLEDTFFIIPSGDYQRLIFTHMELREVINQVLDLARASYG